MFDSVLVANRGEISARITRTLQRMGIESVAVHSDADAAAPFVRRADRAVRIGPAAPARSYLDFGRIVDAAISSGCQAVHPGYGFLSESPTLARACSDAGITFIGPSVAVLEMMGDKISAKLCAAAAGVPILPGRHEPGMDDDALAAAIEEVGAPVILKPSAGGGGKGMVIVRHPEQAREAIASARRVARSAFGDDTLLVERYVERPRHVEVQVLGDSHGRLIHLGERECTLQRRHQKVVEEAPSPFLDDASRAALCSSAVRLASRVGYVGAGTVEYVVSGTDPSDFAFLEMNTRLQVEHPVTEEVTGLDLVEWQVRVAAGEPLPFTQELVRIQGHAVEARVYAEDPGRGFLPDTGTLLAWSVPEGVRCDSGVEAGTAIGAEYDPMLAKVIAHGPTREAALERLRAALGGTVALGVTTNLQFLRALLDDDDVAKADLDTGLVERVHAEQETASPSAAARAHAATVRRNARVREAAGPARLGAWDAADSWRLGGSVAYRCLVEDEVVEIAPEVTLPADLPWALDGEVVWLHDSSEGNLRLDTRALRDRRLRSHGPAGATGPWAARSPMPGQVVEVPVAVGDIVAEGDPLAVVEAMKMEHTIRAPAAGTVTSVEAEPGAQVRLDDVLVRLDRSERS